MKRVTKHIKTILAITLVLVLCFTMATAVLGEENGALKQEDQELFYNSYDSIVARLTGRGYAATSLTGAYRGMFIRDSAIQAMAHLAYGEADKAQKILEYLIRYHEELQSDYAVRIIGNLTDEAYGNTHLSGLEEDTVEGYTEFLEYPNRLFQTKADDHKVAWKIVPTERTIQAVRLYLDSTDKITVSILKNYQDPDSAVATNTFVTNQSGVGWYQIPLSATVTPGEEYYIYVQTPADTTGGVLYGKTNTGAVSTYNYDTKRGGWYAANASVAFQLITDLRASTVLTSFKETSNALYALKAPKNHAAAAFIPATKTLSGIRVYLRNNAAKQITGIIYDDITGAKTEVARETFSLVGTGLGWYTLTFAQPVTVEPGHRYAFALQVPATDSGEAAWMGKTNVEPNRGYNYLDDEWKVQAHAPAFELIPDTRIDQGPVAQEIRVHGDSVEELRFTLRSAAGGGKVTVRLCSDLQKYDGDGCIATAQTDIRAGTAEYQVTLNAPAKVQEKQPLYVVLTAENASGTVTWIPSDEMTPQLTAYVTEHTAQGEIWSAIEQGMQLTVLPEFSGDYKMPLISLGGDMTGGQELPSNGKVITAVRVLLGKKSGAAGKITATLYKGSDTDGQYIDSCSVETGELTEKGDWVEFPFRLPVGGTEDGERYFLSITAPQSKENSIVWFGTSKLDTYKTSLIKGDQTLEVEGEASFDCRMSEIKAIDSMIQVDGHYMLLHAWALWALQAEDTPEKAAFIEESWPTVSAYASYFINDQYIDSALKLVRNPNYEHTGAGGGMIETYDLITNAFMSQALHELSTIAQQRGDKEQADLWKKTSELIVEGVEENLVMTASGKEIYAELLNNKKELSTGLSFVSWGPVAAEWYGINSERMANTYEIYRKYGSLEFGNISMLNIYFDLKSNKRSNHVVGKAVAWELMYNRAIGDEERVEELLTFMRENSTPGGVYPENWVVDGRISDVGNQEQVSWILYAMIKLFPQLTVDPSAPESSDPSSPNVSSSVSDSSSQVGSHISDPGNSSVQAPTSAASQDDSSHSVTQSAVGSEPESDSPVTGHTIGILSALLAAISAMCVVAFRNKTGKQPG